jgi:hypothetical protein
VAVILNDYHFDNPLHIKMQVCERTRVLRVMSRNPYS